MKKAKAKSRSKRHTSIENVSLFGATMRMAPPGLHLYAEYYFNAAKAAPTARTQFTPAKTFLVCRAIELALKAFLSLKGVSLEALSGGQFGHDLASLLREANRVGLNSLVPLNGDHQFQIERASEYYCEKVFEYPAIYEALKAYPGYPDTGLLMEIAEKLIEKLEKPCIEAE